jgi:transposase
LGLVDTETGELVERRLDHSNGEAEKFYAELQKPVRVGMEATGYAQWFERMLAKLGHELWVGDAAEIRAAMVRKQKLFHPGFQETSLGLTPTKER